MFNRTLYYLGPHTNPNLPGLIRKLDKSKFEKVYTQEITDLTEQAVRKNYVKITPYASAGIIRFLDFALIDSLQLVVVFETTDKMVNTPQYGIKINLLKTFMSISDYADSDIFDYIPRNTTETIMILTEGYTNIKIESAIHLYRDDYVDNVMELIDEYGIDKLRKRFERYVDIEKPKLFKVLSDSEYRDAIYKSIKNIFSFRFKIYEIADKYINELIKISKNVNYELSEKQQEALCELDKVTHPLASYPIDRLFESSIIENTFIIMPFSHTIPIDKLKKNNPLYDIIILRGEQSNKIYIVMYREKSILTTNNPEITGFTIEEMNKIRNSIAL